MHESRWMGIWLRNWQFFFFFSLKIHFIYFISIIHALMHPRIATQSTELFVMSVTSFECIALLLVECNIYYERTCVFVKTFCWVKRCSDTCLFVRLAVLTFSFNVKIFSFCNIAFAGMCCAIWLLHCKKLIDRSIWCRSIL